ncbi:UNVERIFIED_CONTAM: hypothetical protein HDU68_009908 [Siphonaria sp. JEL0065]|nr:hypothetical protein HDU68_009908 [Siphonaria sp. JEL0065]
MLLAFVPTDPSKAATIPEFLPPMLQKCANKIISDMKLRSVAFTPTTFSALYKSHIADPRKAIAVHEIARSKSQSTRTLFISDTSIRVLIGVLLYGGGKEFRTPDVYIQRSGPILAYRTMSTGTKPTLVDIASIVEDLWHDLESFDIQPSRNTLLAFIEAFGVFGEKNMVEKVHKRLSLCSKRKGEELDLSAYQTLMAAHEACGNYLAVIRLFDALETSGLIPTSHLLNANLRCLSRLDQHAALLESFDQVSSRHQSNIHRIQPTDEGIHLILTSLVKLSPSPEVTTPYLTAVESFLTSTIDFSNSHRPISIASYVSLITASCALSNLSVAQTAYKNMKSNVTLRNNHSNAPEIFTSRLAVAFILRLLAKTNKTLDPALAFFRQELFTKDRVTHHCIRIRNGAQKQYLLKKSKLTAGLDECSSLSRKCRLEALISALDKENEKGVKMRMGKDGPFGQCYEALEVGFREGLENRVLKQGGVELGSSLDRGMELMGLADELALLEREEHEMVIMCCEEAGVNVFVPGEE